MKILDQVNRNLVAIISLVVAVTSLSYAAWRNEVTEANRNVRTAGFEMLMNLGDLQRIVYLGHYDRDPIAGNPRKGWVRVMILRDLGTIMPDPLPRESSLLIETWKTNWQGIGNDPVAVDAIEEQIETLRQAVLNTLKTIE
ncbi:MAG: hypothetical protein ACWA5Q_09650 [bacterium]